MSTLDCTDFENKVRRAFTTGAHQISFDTPKREVVDKTLQRILVFKRAHFYAASDELACRFLDDISSLLLAADVVPLERAHFEVLLKYAGKIRRDRWLSRPLKEKVLAGLNSFVLNYFNSTMSQEIPLVFARKSAADPQVFSIETLHQLFRNLQDYFALHLPNVELIELGAAATGKLHGHDLDIGFILPGSVNERGYQGDDQRRSAAQPVVDLLRDFPGTVNRGSVQVITDSVNGSAQGVQTGRAGVVKVHFDLRIPSSSATIRADFVITKADSRGAVEVCWAAGPEVVREMERHARKNGYLLTPAGLFKQGADLGLPPVPTRTARDLYTILGLDYIPPRGRNSAPPQYLTYTSMGVRIRAHDLVQRDEIEDPGYESD
ncbi:hypothetical protein JCM10213_000648 [Rhodosporidiobolus nylandii]